ncbi:MAG: hypothetical protein JWR63_60 [Conexibacter sp.]|nr:hypothetical protein [Conexibacter sp.]
MEAAPVPPSRRAVWALRLVLYPVVVALLAVAWHQRQADAGAEAGVHAVTVPASVGFGGATDRNGLTTAVVRHGRLLRFRSWYRLTCGQGPRSTLVGGWFWIGQTAFAVGRDGRTTAAWPAGTPFRWDGVPRATASLRFAARVTPTSLRGSFSVAVDRHRRRGAAPCRSGTVRFALTPRLG